MMPLANTVINNWHVQRIVRGSNLPATTTKVTVNEAIIQIKQEPSALYFLAADEQMLQQPFICIRFPNHYNHIYPRLFSDYNWQSGLGVTQAIKTLGKTLNLHIFSHGSQIKAMLVSPFGCEAVQQRSWLWQFPSQHARFLGSQCGVVKNLPRTVRWLSQSYRSHQSG